MGIIVILASIGTLNAVVAGVPCILYGMALTRQLPALRVADPSPRAPWVGIVIIAAIPAVEEPLRPGRGSQVHSAHPRRRARMGDRLRDHPHLADDATPARAERGPAAGRRSCRSRRFWASSCSDLPPTTSLRPGIEASAIYWRWFIFLLIAAAFSLVYNLYTYKQCDHEARAARRSSSRGRADRGGAAAAGRARRTASAAPRRREVMVADKLRELAEAGVTRVRVHYTDLIGTTRAKVIPLEVLEEACDDGLNFCVSVFAIDHTGVMPDGTGSGTRSTSATCRSADLRPFGRPLGAGDRHLPADCRLDGEPSRPTRATSSGGRSSPPRRRAPTSQWGTSSSFSSCAGLEGRLPPYQPTPGPVPHGRADRPGGVIRQMEDHVRGLGLPSSASTTSTTCPSGRSTRATRTP